MKNRWVSGSVTTLLSFFILAALGQTSAAEDQQTNWKLVGQVGGPTQAVAVQGNYAYVGVGLRLVVLDVSNPTALREVGTTAPFPYFVEGVIVSGSQPGKMLLVVTNNTSLEGVNLIITFAFQRENST
jgi:hypothetical protein